MAGERWIVVHEGDRSGSRTTASHRAEPGRRVPVGREGEILIGVRVPSRGISRRALYVTPTPLGWRIEVCNRNGAVLHPWGQPAQLATADDTVNWPLVGVRLRDDASLTRHWVLLSADDLAVNPAGPTATDAETEATAPDPAGRPGQLPPAEREALAVVFGELLAWPPRYPAAPLLLKQAAPRIGISVSGLQSRLQSARDRAERLGVTVDPSLAHPSYLYALVRAGYLPLPTAPARSHALMKEHGPGVTDR
jgi:hypothetical protein